MNTVCMTIFLAILSKTKAYSLLYNDNVEIVIITNFRPKLGECLSVFMNPRIKFSQEKIVKISYLLK